MRIAILADPLDNQNAGVHIFIKSLVEQLISRKDGHTYILIRQTHDPTLPSQLKQIIVPPKKLVGYASWRLFFIIPYFLRKENVDIVIEPAHFGPFNLARRVKRVTVIHDLTPIIFPQYHTWRGQILQNLFLKRILKMADLVVTNSLSTSKDLEKYYPFTKNKNIPILLGKDQFYKPTKDTNILTKNGIISDYILYVGTIEPRKNLSLLLDAFEMVYEQSSRDLQLVIAGGMGWKTTDFTTKLEKHKYKEKILTLGYVEKSILPALYSQAEVFVYPSIYEGFGFPILEAMSCGTPVVCSKSSSLPEVGGELAFYFDATSLTSLSDSILQVLALDSNKRKQLKKLSIEHSEKYSWEAHANILLSTLENMFQSK